MTTTHPPIEFSQGLAKPRVWMNPAEIFASGWHHRDLILRLARREVEARYKGSLLGVVWAVLVPLFNLAVFTLVFTYIFHPTWPMPPGRPVPTFLLLFAGMILLNLFVETVSRGPTLMLAHVSYIKRVLFPLEILPFFALVSDGFTAVVSGVVLVAVYLGRVGLPPPTAALLPVVLLPMLVLIVGLLWFVSALGVYLRDLKQVVGVFLGTLGFVSPLFYSMEAFPPPWRWALYLNPLTVPLEQTRRVLFYGQMPSWTQLAAYLAAAWAVAWLGRVWFTHAQRGFADVV